MKRKLCHLALFILTIFTLTPCYGIGTLTHSSRLEILKKKGFNPAIIYDIGAFRGMWSLEVQHVYPNAKFYLFEANETHKPFLEKLSFPFFIAALGDHEGMATFYSNNSTGDSLLKEQTQYYAEGKFSTKLIPLTTLGKVVADHHIPLPDLVKMDVQGAEKLIIEGSPDIIKNAEAIILETKILEYNKNAPLIQEMMSLMHKIGFQMIDILEYHYLPSGELNEIDILFVKVGSHLIKTGLLS